jgi:hypothetical protein
MLQLSVEGAKGRPRRLDNGSKHAADHLLAKSGEETQHPDVSSDNGEILFGLWPANKNGTTEAWYLLVAAVAVCFLSRSRRGDHQGNTMIRYVS